MYVFTSASPVFLSTAPELTLCFAPRPAVSDGQDSINPRRGRPHFLYAAERLVPV